MFQLFIEKSYTYLIMDFTLNNGDFGIVYTNPAEGLKTIGQGN
jgi:hypothetical protein